MELAVENVKRAGRRADASAQKREAEASESHLHPALHLQQQAGNQAMQQLLRSGLIRAKLQVSHPNDPEEQEADVTADRVMRSHAVAAVAASTSCGCSDEDSCECSGGGPKIARSAAGAAGAAPQGFLHSLRASVGHPLDHYARAFFEPRFGRDLSQVRVHTDATAASSARAINAHAFAAGSNIFFAPGRYAPGSEDGQRLLAHELTHVAQMDETPQSLQRLHRQPAPTGDSAPAAALAGGMQNRTTRPVSKEIISALERTDPEASGGVGDFISAFRILNGLAMFDMLATLDELKDLGSLTLLQDNIESAIGVDRSRIEVAMAAVRERGTVEIDEFSTAQSTAYSQLPDDQQKDIQRFLSAKAPQALAVPAAGNLSTTGADAFEPGVSSITNAASDPNWVENDIVEDVLSKQAPWTYTLTYKGGEKIVIPLEQIFTEPLAGATITVYRKHKASGRIIPCILAQADPRLKSLNGPVGSASNTLAGLASPRFDSRTAPKIVNLVNASQMLFLATGMLNVLEVQAMNPLFGTGIGIVGRAAEAATGKMAGKAAGKLGGAAAKEGFTFVEIGAGDLKASIELAKKGGVRVIAVEPVEPAATAVQELQGLGGQFIKGVAADVAPATADHVFQYFPWNITGTGSWVQGGTWRLISDTVRMLKPNGAAHFVTEEYETAKFLAEQASSHNLRAVITETTAGAAAPGAAGAQVPNFSSALKVWMVNIYK
jgi:hypothetical protein